MNVNEMMNEIYNRTEDTAKDRSAAIVLAALDVSQKKTVQLLHPAYLTAEFTHTAEAIGTTGDPGAMDISVANLGYNVLLGAEGILNVKINGGLFCKRQEIKNLKELENPLNEGSANNPIFYVFQNKLYVDSDSPGPIVDVYFLRMPNPLLYKFAYTGNSSKTTFLATAGQDLSAVNDYYKDAVIYNLEKSSYHVITGYNGTSLQLTVTPAAAANFGIGSNLYFYFLSHDFDQLKLTGVTPDLNAAFHPIMLDLAESEIWAIDRRQDRAQLAYKKAIDAINIENAKIMGAAPKGA